MGTLHTLAVVILLGDSITAQMPHCDGVRALGIGSETTAGLRRRVEGGVASGQARVDILTGINDIALGVSIDEAVGNIRATRDTLTAMGASVRVVEVLPVAPSYKHPIGGKSHRINARVDELNARLRSTGVATVAVRLDGQSYQADGIHLSARGYHLLAGALGYECG